MAYAIETTGLTKRFIQRRRLKQIVLHPLQRKTITALDGIDLQIKEGEIFGILGPNGAGKTTLIKVLSTLILPDKGKAWVNGYDILRHPESIKQSIGLVTSEERSFYWRLSGRGNLQFFATLYNMSSSQAERRIDEIFKTFELQDKANDLFHTYSTGIKQKLALARGLLNNPQILFIDEPTKSLDPIAAHDIRKLIREKLVKEQGKTVFLATHNLEEAEEICDHLDIIEAGRILCQGTPSEIRKSVSKEEKYILKVRDLKTETLEKIENQKEVVRLSHRCEPADPSISTLEIHLLKHESTLSLLMETLVRAGVSILDCSHFKIPLEDVFAQIIKERSSNA